MKNYAVWFTAPHKIEIREEEIHDPEPHQALVKTLLSAISSGTEMLMYRGEFPRDLVADDTIVSLQEPLQYPLRYGYCAVGRVVATGNEVDKSWQGRLVFSFQPHQEFFLASVEELNPVPKGIAAEDAVFLPNTETAVNFLLDGRPLVGEKVVVFGQGIVGLLTVALLARFPLDQLITVDRLLMRRETSVQLGAHKSLDPMADSYLMELQNHLRQESDYAGADLVYELTGNPGVLNLAIGSAGFNGRVVIGSWYGSKQSSLDLGGKFHRSRISLISSQVSTMTPELSARWSKRRRLSTAWDMIRQIEPKHLITHRIDFSEARIAYELLDQKPETALQVVLQYPF